MTSFVFVPAIWRFAGITAYERVIWLSDVLVAVVLPRQYLFLVGLTAFDGKYILVFVQHMWFGWARTITVRVQWYGTVSACVQAAAGRVSVQKRPGWTDTRANILERIWYLFRALFFTPRQLFDLHLKFIVFWAHVATLEFLLIVRLVDKIATFGNTLYLFALVIKFVWRRTWFRVCDAALHFVCAIVVR